MIRGAILLDGITGTGLGVTFSPRWERLALAAALKQIQPWAYELYLACTGGTATVQYQEGNTVGTLATVNTFTLANPQVVKFVGRNQKNYSALNVSAISGATLNAWILMP